MASIAALREGQVALQMRLDSLTALWDRQTTVANAPIAPILSVTPLVRSVSLPEVNEGDNGEGLKRKGKKRSGGDSLNYGGAYGGTFQSRSDFSNSSTMVGWAPQRKGGRSKCSECGCYHATVCFGATSGCFLCGQ